VDWRDLIFTILNVIFIIIGGSRYSEKRRKEAEHFRDIEQNCLEPTLKELQGLRERFMISETRPLHMMCKQLKSETDWWESFSFRKIADPLLYEDLRDHYRDLYQDLESTEAWVKTKYPDFLHAIRKLLEMISGGSEYKEFKDELEKIHTGEEDPFWREGFPRNVILCKITCPNTKC